MKTRCVLALSLVAILCIAATKSSGYPQFSLLCLDGKRYSSKSLRGQAVFLTFFASWCGPCRKEVPFLNELTAKYPDALTIVGIGFKESDKNKLGALAKQWGIKYPVSPDPDGKAARGFRVNTLPRGFLIDHKGKLLKRYEGMSAKNRQDLTKRLANLQQSIKRYQSTGPGFYVSVFEEANESAAGQGSIWQARITSWLKAKGIGIASSPQDADYIISGNISKISKIVGVEIVINHSSGAVEYKFSDSVIGGKDDRLRELLNERLQAIPFAVRKQ
ncbi:MAG: redoxin family protein [Deltaproteobacteria bacterium]|nr:redoxin family protein [Deltaproteobacteria bacterium]